MSYKLDALKKRAKTIAIIFLSALLLFQIWTLWFVNITNGELINRILALNDTPEARLDVLAPGRIIVSRDGGLWAYYGADFWAGGALALRDFLLKESFSYEIASNAPLSEGAIIFEYFTPLVSDWLSGGIGASPDNFLNMGLEAVSRIIFFERDIYFKIPEQENYIRVIDVFDEPLSFPEERGAEYALQNGAFMRTGIIFPELFPVFPYADEHGILSLEQVRTRVGKFFNHPPAIQMNAEVNVWIYRDLNAVVRYEDNHVLEFAGYTPIARHASNFWTDLAAALDFIKSDAEFINDFFLANYEYINGLRVFAFDLAIKNTPLLLPNENPLGLEHAVYVTVDHGFVIRYRKYARAFLATGEFFLHDLGRAPITQAIAGISAIGDLREPKWFLR